MIKEFNLEEFRTGESNTEPVVRIKTLEPPDC